MNCLFTNIMPPQITINNALQLEDGLFVDVRAPIEFEKDHILEAVNVPILDNMERHVVGKIYKQVCQKTAIEKGMKYYEKKIPQMAEFIKQFKDKTLVVYCWRGGMRSQIVASLFESLGYTVFQLKEGYKSYRKFILDKLTNFKLKPQVIVLHGLSCTGKTALLHKLPNSVDLEGLAQHRGSLYGAIGLKPHTQKMFDNLLLKRLDELNEQKFLFVEGESRRIGDLMLPEVLWKAMSKGTNVSITRDLDVRIKEMVSEYFLNPKIVEEIKEISQRLWKVISKKKKQEMLDCIEQGKFAEAARILLVNYYDPLYEHTLNKMDYALEVNCNDVDKAVEELKKFVEIK